MCTLTGLNRSCKCTCKSRASFIAASYDFTTVVSASGTNFVSSTESEYWASRGILTKSEQVVLELVARMRDGVVVQDGLDHV